MSPEFDEYHAAGLSDVARPMGELALPTRPRFVTDLMCLPADGGVYVLGAEVQFLGGAAIAWLFEHLIPQLDGTRTLQALRECFTDLPADALDDMLYLLQMHGMLEAGLEHDTRGSSHGLEADFGSQMSFFSRYLRVTGRRANRYEAQESLVRSHVVILGDGPSALLLESELLEHGIGRVERIGGTDPSSLERDADLVVSIGALEHQRAVMRSCINSWLPILFVDNAGLVLGPLTEPGITACPGCVREQLPADLGHPPVLSPRVAAMWRRALISRATQRALCRLTQLYQTDRCAAVEVWRPDMANAVTYDSVLCLPNCEICGRTTTARSITLPAGREESAALLFHRNTWLKPTDLGHPASMQQHLTADVARLTQTAFREHEGAVLVHLPEPSGPGIASDVSVAINWVETSPDRVCSAESLGTILGYSGGGRGLRLANGYFHIQRYTASGGNLGSAELYLVVRRAGRVPQGLYHYSLLAHALEALPTDPDECGRREWLAAQDGEPGVSVIVISDVSREFSKYGGRGYTYCLLDAGLIAHRLQLLAAASGLRSTLSWDFDDDAVSRMLGVQPPFSTPTCIVGIGA